MMLFRLFAHKDIHQGIKAWKATQGAVLLDVRTEEEYADYHIDGSLNIPLQVLSRIASMIPDKKTPIFVHCLSGGRSAKALRFLKSQGYTQVTDIGGISSYRENAI